MHLPPLEEKLDIEVFNIVYSLPLLISFPYSSANLMPFFFFFFFFSYVFVLQEYIDAHPETIILDPLPAIRTLLDRSKSYELIRQIEAYMQGRPIPALPEGFYCE